jgi:hypothetical protein
MQRQVAGTVASGERHCLSSRYFFLSFLFRLFLDLFILLFFAPWFEDHQGLVHFRHRLHRFLTLGRRRLFCCELGFCGGPPGKITGSRATTS